MSGKTATTANYWAITVPGRDVHQDGQGAEFVSYRHEATKGNEKHTFLSRYARFVWLDEQVREAYKGNHMLSSVPSLPKKQWKLWVDHKSTEFLDDRQAQLQFYMQKLARIPGIENVPAFITFITSNGTSEQVGKSLTATLTGASSGSSS